MPTCPTIHQRNHEFQVQEGLAGRPSTSTVIHSFRVWKKHRDLQGMMHAGPNVPHLPPAAKRSRTSQWAETPQITNDIATLVSWSKSRRARLFGRLPTDGGLTIGCCQPAGLGGVLITTIAHS